MAATLRAFCAATKHRGTEKDTLKLGVNEKFLPANHPVASANQNAAINIPREKLVKWRSCFSHKLKHGSGAKDGWTPNKAVKIK